MYTESQKTAYVVNNKNIKNFLGYPEDYPIEKIVNDLIAYLRKSRKDEELYGNEAVEETLARHTKTLQEWAISIFGVPIPEENLKKEVVSGESIDGRPVMQEVLRMIESPKYRAVICVDVQRLGRGDLEDQGRMIKVLQFSNTKVLTPNQWFDLSNKFDKKFFEQKMRESKEYLEYVKEIMGSGRMRSVLDGTYPHSIAPYGFNRVRITGAKGYTLEYNEYEYKVCKLAVDLLKNGLHVQYTIQDNDSIEFIAKTFGITKSIIINDNTDIEFKTGNTLKINVNSPGTSIISNYFNFLGIQPRNNCHWTPHMIRNILLSISAHGFVSWGRRKTVISLQNGNFLKSRPINNQDSIIVKGRWNPIYTDDEIRIITNYFSSNSKPIRNDKTIKNPLIGLIKCDICKSNMQRRPYSNKDTHIKQRLTNKQKTKLRLLLRRYKGNYSLNDIARNLHMSKFIIDHWFASNDEKFCVPHPDKWLDLKKMLNITTNEFDDDIMISKNSIHSDMLICNTHNCNNISSDLNLVEKKIIDSLKDILKDYKDYIENYSTKIKEEKNSNEKTLEIINKKIEIENQKLNKLCDLLESEVYSEKLFIERKQKIDIEISKLEKKKKELSSKDIYKNLEKKKKMVPLIQEVINNYNEKMTPENRNKLLSSIIKVIYYKKSVGGKKYKDKFTLKIYLKI